MTNPIPGPMSGLPEPQKPRPTLGDWFIRGIQMHAKCTCGAERIVPTYTLIEKLGAGKTIKDEDLPELAKRMRCETCRIEGRGRGSVTLYVEW